MGPAGAWAVQYLGGRRADRPAPQALHIYECEGLLDPARSSGGTRRYSTEDIGRPQQIMALTADGLNLAGVRRVLELQKETRQLQAEIEQLKAAARGRAVHKAIPHQAVLAGQQDTSG